jgi:hypothetical protein
MYFCEHIIPVLEQLGARLTSLREQPPTPSLRGDFNAGSLSYENSQTFSLELKHLPEDKNISHFATAPQNLSVHQVWDIVHRVWDILWPKRHRSSYLSLIPCLNYTRWRGHYVGVRHFYLTKLLLSCCSSPITSKFGITGTSNIIRIIGDSTIREISFFSLCYCSQKFHVCRL